MAERTTELTRDIESTRDHMTTTLDAIGDRVSPARVVERRWNGVRQSAGRVRDQVMGVPHRAADRASGATSSMGDSASSAIDGLSGRVEAAGDQLGQVPDRIQSGTQGNPLAAGAVAFGLGVLAGSLGPVARVETDLASKVVEPLQEEARQLGSQVAESVRHDAEDAMEQTKQAATEAVAEVREGAQAAAETVKAEASDSATEVADRAAAAKDKVTDEGGPSAH